MINIQKLDSPLTLLDFTIYLGKEIFDDTLYEVCLCFISDWIKHRDTALGNSENFPYLIEIKGYFKSYVRNNILMTFDQEFKDFNKEFMNCKDLEETNQQSELPFDVLDNYPKIRRLESYSSKQSDFSDYDEYWDHMAEINRKKTNKKVQTTEAKKAYKQLN